MKIITLLFGYLTLVSCIDVPRYGAPIKSLEVYLSFEEPKMVVYGHEKELVTFRNMLNESESLELVTLFKNNLILVASFERYDDMVGKYGLNHFDSVRYKEVNWVVNQESAIEFRWQEQLYIYNLEQEDNNAIREVFFFTLEDFGGSPSTLQWNLYRIKDATPRAKRQIFGDRPRNYSLTFKESKRDEQGILFDLFLINDREIPS